MAEKTPDEVAAAKSSSSLAAAPEKAPVKTPDEIVAEQRAAAAKSSSNLAATIEKATAEKKILITDFAGTIGGVFAAYGENLDKGGQLTVDGQVPEIVVRRSDVIKGRLAGSGLNLKAGSVEVKLGDASFTGSLD